MEVEGQVYTVMTTFKSAPKAAEDEDDSQTTRQEVAHFSERVAPTCKEEDDVDKSEGVRVLIEDREHV